MSKICIGCGVTLQEEDKSKLGYTPDIKKDYCMRCFRLKNYGEVNDNEVIDEELILTKVNNSKGLAFFFVDYLNINNYSLDIFKRIKIDKVLVISKVDVLRKDMKFKKIEEWLKQVYNINDKVLFVSNETKYGIHSVLSYAEKVDCKTLYIMGITNAGKSTFINHLLDEYKINKKIVTSNKPNTTLDFIKIYIEPYVLLDTPGFTYPNMSSKLIQKEIKPITYHLTKDTTIYVGNYTIYFSYPTSVTLYLNSNESKRSFKESLGKKLLVGDNQDIVLGGLGFINVKNKGEVIINDDKYVEIRDSISGVNYG